MKVAPDRVELYAERERLFNAERNMPTFWRTFVAAALGKLFVNLLIAACIALGFGGPNEWVAFLISGMPTFVTPGVARLGLLLIASLGIFLEWWMPIQKAISGWSTRAKRLALAAFAAGCCLPFVAGAFYLTANSTPIKQDRHLTEKQKELMVLAFSKAPQDRLQKAVVASVDDPEAVAYAIEFIYFFKYYNIPIRGYTPSDNRIDLPESVKEFGRLTGLSVSVKDKNDPPESAKALRDAMQQAGFSIEFETLYGYMPSECMLTIRYN